MFASLIKKKRKAKDLSLSELARLAGIAKSNLSRLEKGEGNPSLETLWALSKALDINVRELIDPQPTTGSRIDRGDLSLSAKANAADFIVNLISSCPVGSLRDIYRAVFQPGKPKISKPHGSHSIEHIVILTGKAKIGPITQPEILSEGDYFTFSGNEDHIYEALEKDTSAIIIMEGS